MSSGDATLSDAVRAWLGEEANYHGEKIGEGDFAAWGHYSESVRVLLCTARLTRPAAQCLWRGTTNVAVAKVRAGDGSTWVVGRYTPPGNMSGETPY
jgi:hypothetical protein